MAATAAEAAADESAGSFEQPMTSVTSPFGARGSARRQGSRTGDDLLVELRQLTADDNRQVGSDGRETGERGAGGGGRGRRFGDSNATAGYGDRATSCQRAARARSVRGR